MTQLAQQSSFLDWVKTIRLHATDVDVDEILTCPLIWCRKSFQNSNAIICHIDQCPHLWNAWYWCPHCGRPERYLECNTECEIVPKPRMFEKLNHGLTVAFLKRLFRWCRRRSFGETQNPSDAVETTSGDVSGLEPLQPDRANTPSPQELLGSTPYHIANGAGDTIHHHRNQNPRASLSEFACYDPVYSRAELPDRNNIVVAPDTESAISSANIYELQAGSWHGRGYQYAEIDVENFVGDSRCFVDDGSACTSSFYSRYGEIIDAYTI